MDDELELGRSATDARDRGEGWEVIGRELGCPIAVAQRYCQRYLADVQRRQLAQQYNLF